MKIIIYYFYNNFKRIKEEIKKRLKHNNFHNITVIICMVI